MFTGVLMLSFLVAVVRGGSFGRMARHPFPRAEWLVVGLIVQMLPAFAPRLGLPGLVAWGPYLHLLSYLPLAYFLMGNRRKPGIMTIALGMMLNLLPITANGGKMPVSAAALQAAGLPDWVEALAAGHATHTLINETTGLAFLGDVLYLPRQYPLAAAISIGDIVLAIGIFVLIQHLMLREPAAQ
ncbi:MAG: DUF5317 domain-containing protein [Bacillota bacterium]